MTTPTTDRPRVELWTDPQRSCCYIAHPRLDAAITSNARRMTAGMTAGALFAMTLPGVLLLLVALAAVEKITSKLRRKSILAGEHRPSLGATGLDVFSAALDPGKATELDERNQAKTLRVEQRSRDHNGIDFQAGTASLSIRRSQAEGGH